MTSNSLVIVLTFCLIATAVIPSEARHRTPPGRKSAGPSRRQSIDDPSEPQTNPISQSGQAVDEPSEPEQKSENRLPISKSLARKLSEMLALAVAEAVAQVVEDEPSKLNACTNLLRRHNTNVNINNNQNMKQSLAPFLMRPDDDDDDNDDDSNEDDDEESDEESSSEEEEEEDDERRALKTPQESSSSSSNKNENVNAQISPKPKTKKKNKSSNRNDNINANINQNSFSRRALDETKSIGEVPRKSFKGKAL